MQPLIRLSLALLLIWVPSVVAQDRVKGIFDGDADVGAVRHAGSVEYDSASKTYRVAGGGENMWFTNDAMHFVWKKVSGDVALAADVSLIGAKGNAHRKACLIFRQSLEPDSAYVDAALHGDGLTSLQYRDAKGAFTREIQSNVAAPGRLQIEKRGKYVSLAIAEANGALHPAGGAVRVAFEDPFYVGLAVCAHDDNVLEQAKFSKVELDNPLPPIGAKPRLLSTLETVTIASKDRRVAYWTTNHIEAPNWSHDGTFFIFNQEGHLFRLPLAGGEPQLLDTGSANRCNNDHGISPDGTQLAISDNSQEKHSLISLLPITGGTPRLLTKLGPSYWHGWSPDGKTIAYCAQREGEFDVYTMAVDGGEERRLTTAKGLDDGPEYSPDGKFIYFNSVRSGTMQIWRMRPDGSEQEQVTSDEFNNWFPHLSPDGKWLIFLTYEKEVREHPENKDVMLRIMPVKGGPIEVVAKLFGGQGTMNVPSWSPDSRKVAFVSYQLVP
jgi:TolB protein